MAGPFREPNVAASTDDCYLCRPVANELCIIVSPEEKCKTGRAFLWYTCRKISE